MTDHLRRAALGAALLAATAALLTACGGRSTETLTEEDAPSVTQPTPLGEVEIEVSGIGTDKVSSEWRWDSTASRRRALGAEIDGVTRVSAGLDIKFHSATTTDVGTPGAGGMRYLSAHYLVRNAQYCTSPGTCAPHTTARTNLTFVAIVAPAPLAINNTAVTQFTRFDGSPAAPELALRLVPTHGMNSLGSAADRGRASLQVFHESEVAHAPDQLPYGFVVNHVNGTGRTLPANPAANRFDGMVTIAFKLPLQVNPQDDPHRIALRFRFMEDSNTRVTQSLEESDASALARASALGASDIAVLCNRLSGIARANPICEVRTAGTAARPTAYLTPPAPPGTRYEVRKSANYFLSGHSLTDDPVAATIAAIAQSLDRQAGWNEQIVIGSPIRYRTSGASPPPSNLAGFTWPGYRMGKNRAGSGMDVVAELRNGTTLGGGQRYDSLLITERHDLLDSLKWEGTLKFLRHFHDRLNEGRARSHSFFYQSWLDVDKANPVPWINYERAASPIWQCMATRVNQALAHEGRLDRIKSVPANWALAELVARATQGSVEGISGASTSETLNRIFSDNVHLTLLGRYYVALVSYIALYGSTPVGAWAPSDISATQAASLQNVAWSAMNSFVATQKPLTTDQCRARVTGSFCAAYHEFRGNPAQVSGCLSTYSALNSSNPFYFNAADNASYWYPAP